MIESRGIGILQYSSLLDSDAVGGRVGLVSERSGWNARVVIFVFGIGAAGSLH